MISENLKGTNKNIKEITEKNLIEKLIEKSKKRDYDEAGGNSRCYLFDNYALLESNIFKAEKIETIIKKSKELKEKGVNVARTLDYRIDENSNEHDYVLQERAKGEILHRSHGRKRENNEEFLDNYLKKLLSLGKENQQFYDKFVSDWITIIENDVVVDPSKTSNFFYEKGKGIEFIDLGDIEGSRGKEYHLAHIPIYTLDTLCGAHIFHNIKKESPKTFFEAKILSIAIIDKLIEALEHNNYNKEEVKEEFKNEGFDFDIEKLKEEYEIYKSNEYKEHNEEKKEKKENKESKDNGMGLTINS